MTTIGTINAQTLTAQQETKTAKKADNATITFQ